MKRKILIIAVTFLFVLTTAIGMVGCYGIHGGDSVTGSQNLETREFTFSDFTRIEVSAPFEVEISRSDIYRVSVTSNENLFDYIEVTQSGDTLRLRLEPFISFRHTTFQATITMPELNSLELSGASSTEMGEFQTTSDVDINVSGASRLTITSLQVSGITMDISGASRAYGFVQAEVAKFNVSGVSNLELSGLAVAANLEVSGVSSLKLQDFRILNASVNISAASNGIIEVNGRLDLEVSGASSLTYSGDPTLGRVEVSGASSLHRQ